MTELSGEAPPNVIVILSDDHGYGDRGHMGTDPAVSTPALDALAASGVECTNAYVAAPICSPSRCGIVSGRYPLRWGVHWFGDSRFPDEYPSIAERFLELGYATGYLGKVHFGQEDVGDRGTPPHHGFQETYYGLAGKQSGRLNYLVHSQEAVQRYGTVGQAQSAVQPMLEGDDEVELDGFLTRELGDRALDFVSRHEGEPFFLQLSFNAVHNFCWQLPPEELAARGLPSRDDFTGDDRDAYLEWYEGSITPNLEHGREYYLAQLELMDREIGRLDERLKELGLYDNTLVVYLTDNGGSPCNYGDNTPLHGTKYTLWEGGIRVPFLVRWPAGGIDGGRRCEGTVSAMDLYPSLLAAAGADSCTYSDCDGLDQIDLWRGARADGHGELHWDSGFQWASRVGDHKLAWVDGSHPSTEGIRRVEHAEPGDGLRLFDVRHDPSEQHDLLEERPDLVESITAARAAFLARVAAEPAVDPGS